MSDRFRSRLRGWLQKSFLLRVHMLLILTGTFLAGLLCTKVLLELGVDLLALRYAASVVVAYLTFLLLIRVWLWYVRIRAQNDSPVDGIDFIQWAADDGPAILAEAGGRFGGAGASGSWEGTPAVAVDGASDGGSLLPDLDLGEGLLALLFLAIVLLLFAAGGYLIYAAPTILADAAVEALLAAALLRRARRLDSPGWAGSIVRATLLPFVVTLILAVLLGVAANYVCPGAERLIDVVGCEA